MKPVLCLLKTYPINFSNLFLGGILHSHANILGPCQYTFNNQGFLALEIGTTGEILAPANPQTSFRRMSWLDQHRLDRLDDLLGICQDQNQMLCFGSHLTSNIEYLKARYGKQCLTVGITYRENLYPFLLDNMARYHVFMLEHHMIEPNQWDRDHVHALERPALIQHYCTEFDRLGLIDQQNLLTFDYNFALDDYFDSDRLVGHYMALGFDNADRFREYHCQWLSCQ